MPVRLPSDDWALRFAALPAAPTAETTASPPKRLAAGQGRQPHQSPAVAADEPNRQERLAHRALLRNELLKARIDDIRVSYCIVLPTAQSAL